MLHLDREEVEVLRRLLAELRGLLTGGPTDDLDPDTEARVAALTTRLFPPAHANDPDQEAEYQRLMRDELVSSRLAAIDTVESFLDRSGLDRSRLDRSRQGSSKPLAEQEVIAFMQSVNAIRLVLGTILGVDDAGETPVDSTDDGVADDLRDEPEYHLYDYLSWLLEWTVRALSS